MLDPTTLAAYRAAQTAQARAQAVRDSLGSGTLTVELREGASLVYTGTFSGPMTAGSDGSLSASAQLSGLVTTAGTPNAATWTCRIANGSGRYIEGSFGPGGRFTWSQGTLRVGDVVRLDVSILPPGGVIPSWRVGLAQFEWSELAGTAMANFPPSVDPGRDSGGPAAKLDAWCGLAIDTRDSTVWSLANGGHDDYHGNEVMKFTLGADEPEWIEVLESSSGFTIPSDSAYYSDGRPASTHTYYMLQFIEARNRAIRFGVGASSTVGNPKVNIDGFNSTVAVGVNGWDAAGTYPNLPAALQHAVCKNPATEDVFIFIDNGSVQQWTQATNTLSQVNVGYPPVSFNETASAYDTTRDRIFLWIGGGAAIHTFDPATGGFTARTFTGAGAAALNGAAKGGGMVYVPSLDSYLVRLKATGGAVYKIDAATFDVTVITTTGGAAIPATAALSGANENVYGRWLRAPNLGGVVYFPSYAANAWFLATE
jgi:hypothetical protein